MTHYFKIAVRWGDMDAYQHVNNTVYFQWIESARIEFLDDVVKLSQFLPSKCDVILKSVECIFDEQIKFKDNVTISTLVERIGGKSFTLLHEFASESFGGRVAYGKSIVVVFDFTNDKAIEIPLSLRNALALYARGESVPPATN